jgi:carboxyl-terminal processing protease
LATAIGSVRAQAGGQLRGLILDLRNNHGGLLDQAVQVADLFLSEGVILKTVSRDRSEVKQARSDREDTTSVPMVVLVNNSSAAGSEIVASALKDNDRALVVGRQTFGSGSIQVLLDDAVRGTALKLTVARWLTPGEVSIQDVGITPDLLLLPGCSLKDAVSYYAPPRSAAADRKGRFAGPGEYRRPFTSPSFPRAGERGTGREKAAAELRYLIDVQEDQDASGANAERSCDEAKVTDEFVEDYPVRFARELLARAPFADRPRLLRAGIVHAAERRAGQDARLEAKLAKLGVAWSSGPVRGKPQAVVTVMPPPGARSVGGDKIAWTVNVENRGDGDFRRLRAWSLVEKNSLLDRREFIFGAVRPGERRSWTVPLAIPMETTSRHDEVVLH